jgi:hypothetical protein
MRTFHGRGVKKQLLAALADPLAFQEAGPK